MAQLKHPQVIPICALIASSFMNTTTLFNPCHLITPVIAISSVLAVIAFAHVVPYYMDRHNLRKYPGPFLARFSDIWLAYVSLQGQRSEVVHRLHLRYGTHVRIAPNHLSISDPSALQVIYAYGNGTLKTDFYDALVSICPSVFNTRDRAEHTRKRKAISHVFSAARVADFEPRIREHVTTLTKKWDEMFSHANQGNSGAQAGGWFGAQGRLWMDCLPWLNYLSFDMTGDLVFGMPFGMLKAGNDFAPVTEGRGKAPATATRGKQQHVSAIESRSQRGKVLVGTAVLPKWLRPIIQKILTFSAHRQGADAFTGITTVAVSKRLETPSDRLDLMSKLQETKSAQGQPISREEITAEAIGQLVAGSTTVSNTVCAALYYLARDQRVQLRLQAELDDHLGTEDETASTLEQVKRLPYLDKVLNETMRIHSTSSIGLPRVLPKGGIDVAGEHFLAGTTLSVPTFTIHRDKYVWGEDADDFRPERWDEQNHGLVQKTFNPFSYGPRACVGRNLALLELRIIVSSLVRRYHFVLCEEYQTLDMTEEFLRKATSCRLGVKPRNIL